MNQFISGVHAKLIRTSLGLAEGTEGTVLLLDTCYTKDLYIHIEYHDLDYIVEKCAIVLDKDYYRKKLKELKC